MNEQIVIGADTNHPLNGVLTLPDTMHDLVPGVVLVHGSGPSNMDEKIGNVAPFKDFAEGLSARGIAVLRYDKRTFVYAKQMRADKAITVRQETIEDALLATDLLRRDPRVDSRKVFILGHSMGGMLAPRIDAEGGCFAGIIIMAGSPRKLEELIIDQSHDVVASLNRFLRIIAKKQVTKLSSKFRNIYNLTDDEAKSTRVMGKGVTAYYFKEMGEYPSVQCLRELDKPVLIAQGDRDLQVSVERDFALYKSILGDKPNVTFKLYPNLNHAFVPALYSTILKAKKEYKVARGVDQRVLNDVADWIFSAAPDPRTG